MTATDPTPARRRALEAFYAAHHRRLTRAVFSRARGIGDDAIDDACAHAWLMLVRRADVTLDARGLHWLVTVAVYEAWRLGGAREVPVGAFLPDPDNTHERAEPAGPWSDPLERVLALELQCERVAAFATLKPRERRELFLKAACYRYHEIMALTGTTYTAVNRYLTEGRARLRRAE
jgi:DNA-directed RNA polymerase specialized sigma24 family protein